MSLERPPPPSDASASVGANLRRWRLLQRLLLLVAAVLVVAFGLALWLVRPATPRLTTERLALAQARWQTSGPGDYDIEIVVEGDQPAIYAVEVRDGDPIAASRNGAPLPQRRTWETWSVPGMFDTLTSDATALEQRPGLVARCAFDPRYGFPAAYERYERTDTGVGRQIQWRVTRFEPQ